MVKDGWGWFRMGGDGSGWVWIVRVVGDGLGWVGMVRDRGGM